MQWYGEMSKKSYDGKSSLDAGTLKEGVVIWFKNHYGKWEALKFKNETLWKIYYESC